MDLSVEQQNQLERERKLSQMRERAQIFREVFGEPDKPTKHGKLILDALHSAFGRGLPKNMLDDHGRTDMWQTARRLGHFDVIEAIYETLKWRENEHTRQSGP